MADMGDALAEMLAQGIKGYTAGSLERRKLMQEREEKQRAIELELRKELIKDTIKKQLGLSEPKEWKPSTMQEALDLERAKAGIVKPKEQEKLIRQEAGDAEISRFLEQTPVRQKYLERLSYARPAELSEAESRLMGGYKTPEARKMILGIGLPKQEKEQKAQATTIRKEFEQQSKTFRDVSDAYSRIQQSYKMPSAAGDLALIFNYMKVLDPGSTVREGEFATAENSRGIDDMTRGIYNKILRGTRLTPKQRDDFFQRSGMLYSAKEEEQRGLENSYANISRGMGLSPNLTITKYKKPIIPTQKRSTAIKTGGRMMQDASGNKAIVYPDGSFEEIK